MKRVRRRVWFLIAATALTLIVLFNLPSAVVLLDPRKHSNEPHGSHDPALVGLWVREGEGLNRLLDLEKDGRATGGLGLIALWHSSGNTVTIDGLSICGNGNQLGSFAREYTLVREDDNVIVLECEGNLTYEGRYRRVNPMSPEFIAKVRRELESGESLGAYDIYRHLRSREIWSDDTVFPDEEL